MAAPPRAGGPTTSSVAAFVARADPDPHGERYLPPLRTVLAAGGALLLLLTTVTAAVMWRIST
ncbi:hypothetical protein ACWGIB_21230 [Streptomyces xiamenensis]